MLINSLILTFYLFFPSAAFAESQFCADLLKTKCCQEPYIINEGSSPQQKLFLPIQEVRLLKTRIQALKANAQKLLDTWEPVLAKLNSENSDLSINPDFVKIEGDFQLLKEITTKLRIASAQRDICITTCNGNRKLELNDEIDHLQKAKIRLLMSQPMLATEELSEIMAHWKEGEIKNEKQIIRNAVNTQVKALKNKITKYNDALLNASDFNRAKDGKFNSEYSFSNYFKRLEDHHSEVLNDVIISTPHPEEMDAATNITQCQLEGRLEKFTSNQHRLGIAKDIGLFVLPFALGPLGRAVSLVPKAPALLKFGLSAFEAGSFVGVEFYRINDKKNICENEKSVYLITSTQMNQKKFEECLTIQNDLELYSNLGWAMASGITTAKLAKLTEALGTIKVKLFTQRNSEYEAAYLKKGVTSLEVNPNVIQTKIDLGKAIETYPEIKTTATAYFDHVGEVYKAKLNLTKKEVADFVETSKQFQGRTELILRTEKSAPIEKSNFLGGVALVRSYKKEDLLPFEKATGYFVSRKEGGVAEVVRLTTNNTNPRETGIELLNEVSIIIKNSPDLKKVYVYTSLIHQRLYKTMGLNLQVEKKLNERDVLLSISADQVRKMSKDFNL